MRIVVGACIGLVTLAIYASVGRMPLVYEDLNWAGQLTAQHTGLWRFPGRMLTQLSFSAQAVNGEAQPGAMHWANVGVHLLVGLSVWALARKMGLSEAGAFVAAAVMLWHPLATAAVAYVSGRSELLMTLFTLGAVLAALERRWSFAWLVAVGVFLAASSKELGALSVVLVLLTLAWQRCEPWMRWSVVGACVLVALSLPWVASVLPGDGWPTWAVWGQLASANVAGVWRVLSLMVVPIRLSIDPDPWVVPMGLRLVGVAALVGVCGWLVSRWRTQRIEAWAWLWILVVLLPRVVVPTYEPIHDHQAYLALVPVSLVVGTWLS